MQVWVSQLFSNWFVVCLGLVAGVLFVHFLWQYVYRGVRLRSELKSIAQQIKGLDGRPRPDLRAALSEIFAKSHLAAAWKEFEDTLHDQVDLADGERRVRDVRATVPAETFINLESVVDPRIGAEYFKHLPGLFTGLGIVGTFNGLIAGLVGFKPNVETEALKAGLAALFNHVQSAFIFSAVAIGMAMLATLSEKWLYAACVKWLGEITSNLDGLFRSGVGEEYLSGLLQASQDNATQTRQLKESMVDDLKVLLTNLTDRQVQATQQLSSDLGQRIESSLKEPLSHLADTVRQASGQQTASASNVLESLMSAFVAQMRETLGGQLGDLSGLMQQTAQSMTQVEAAMRSLVSDMQRASGDSSAAMQSAVRDLVDSLSAHQRQQVEVLDGSTANLLARVESTVQHLSDRQLEMANRSEASVEAVVSAMDARVAALSEANKESAQATAQAIASFGEMSSEAATGMREGAVAVAEAVTRVEKAAERLSHLMQQMTSAQSAFTQSAQQITQSAGVLGSASQSLSTATATLGTTSSRLEAVAKVASTEADMRAQLLKDLGEMTEQSREAGLELASLSDEVRGALAKNVEVFGGSVSKVLSQHLNDYQRQLGDAIGMLKSAVEEMSEAAIDARS